MSELPDKTKAERQLEAFAAYFDNCALFDSMTITAAGFREWASDARAALGVVTPANLDQIVDRVVMKWDTPSIPFMLDGKAIARSVSKIRFH